MSASTVSHLKFLQKHLKAWPSIPYLLTQMIHTTGDLRNNAKNKRQILAPSDGELEELTELRHRQDRRACRRAEIAYESTNIILWVGMIIGRFANTHQAPAVHVLAAIELRMWVLLHEMANLQMEEVNENALEGEILNQLG